HDTIVSQYSVWAVVENSNLNIKNLGVKYKDIESKPTNVRAWMLRLLGSNPENLSAHMEYFRLGMEDPMLDARIGLAKGLKNTYLDGIDSLTLHWFDTEVESEVRSSLLDHFASQGERSSNYERLVLQIYEEEAPESPTRLRIEANAARTSLYPKLSQIKYNGTLRLFGEGTTVVKNKTVINSIENVGALSIGGNADNRGSLNTQYNSEQLTEICLRLAELESYLLQHRELLSDHSRLLDQIRDARTAPTESKLRGISDYLKGLGRKAKSSLDVTSALVTIGTALGKAAGLG
ncbi:MAG: hypothetical protein AB7R90_10055, partial [Reyranellaceae bacterium]